MANQKYNQKRSPKIHPVDIHIAKQLKKVRKHRRFTQNKLGSSLNPPLTAQQIQKYESAKSKIPTSRLIELSDILDCSIIFFLP